MCNLVDLALAADRRPKLFFTSSVGVANGVVPGGTVPEQALSDLAAAGGAGYGQSKLVAENVLLAARERCGVDVTVCRVGQIAGPVREGHRRGGEWSRREWFPSVCPPFSPSLSL